MPTFASKRGSRCTAAALVFALALLPAQGVRAEGARLHKSGPIGVASGGGAVWVANEDNDSVSRIDTGSWDVAADIQNDGIVDISDPIALLGFIFLGGEPPAPPGFTRPCGPDPDPPGSPGDLGCQVASDC